MQPTTDTPFERFAFAAAILLTFVFLLFVSVWCVLVITFPVSPVIWGIDWAALGIIIKRILIVTVVFCLGTQIFEILCAIKIERDHIKALERAEAELSDIILSDMKTLPQNWKPVKTFFVSGNVVLSNDVLKALQWLCRKLVGGESKAFSRLLSRARREATVRVLRQAKECGANVVWNIRYEMSDLRTNWAKSDKSMAGVEILAYATAFAVEAE